MDELDLLDRALPDARPPSAEVVARARARLTGPSYLPARRRTWMWMVTAAAATAAIVTLVFSLVAHLTTAPPAAVAPKPGQALYDLADRIEKLPATSGAYWRQVWVNGNYMRAGGLTYLVSSSHEMWLPRDPADRVLTLSWSEPIASPATPADERAWRAAGSPSRVKFSCMDGRRCPYISVTRTPRQCMYAWDASSGGVLPDHTVGDLTMADLAAFPTDQDRLREKLREFHELWYKRGFKQSFEKFLPTTANLLSQPLRPDQRAALIRLLAGLPSTKVVGTVTDPLGRSALSVDFGTPGSTLVFDRKPSRELPVYPRTLLDPGTGATLADVSYATRTAFGATKDQPMTFMAASPGTGWTAKRPVIPVGCKENPLYKSAKG
ncbi:CU044_5270 family protein [Nonomuraea sp. SMC257]|uniref:CU044_5270 family protein n=1 Tax=Nonomuraea montanisoli TaxID=2741721 RepID=A0A7Y6IEX9_9ACTN|nr:CU044_5270 family protein [Nonomuraea montanisoli]NUW37035.1 CU044_5270 family protein [Nonomuraea montanisoli]